MKRIWRDALFGALVVVLVGLLWWLSTRSEVVPLPADETHRTPMDHQACMVCHGAGGELPLTPDHPDIEQYSCGACHRL